MSLSLKRRKKVFPRISLNFSKNGIEITSEARRSSQNSSKKIEYQDARISYIKLIDKTPPTDIVYKSPRTKTITVLLALFLAPFGVHRYYLRQFFWKGWLSAVFFWTLIPTLISWIDVFYFGFMSKEKFDNLYNKTPQYCPCCGMKLSFLMSLYSKMGNLINGEIVCIYCIAESLKIDKNFIKHSSKKHTPYTLQLLLSGVPFDSLPQPSHALVPVIPPTSPNLIDFKKYIDDARLERGELDFEIRKHQILLRHSEVSRKQLLAPKTPETVDIKNYLSDLYKQYNESQIDIRIEMEPRFQEQYEKVKLAFANLINANNIREIIPGQVSSEISLTNTATVERKKIILKHADFDDILTEHSAFVLSDEENYDIYIYPAFILQTNSSGETALIDLHKLQFQFHIQHFPEKQINAPADGRIIDYIVKRTESSDSADPNIPVTSERLPVFEYGIFELATNSGFKKIYSFSDVKLAETFSEEFSHYLALITHKEDISDASLDFDISPKHNFSYQYYYLLKDFSQSLYSITQKIISDTSISEYLRKYPTNSSSAPLIPEAIISDMVQITRMVAKEKLSNDSLEGTGLLVAAHKILSEEDRELIFNKEYNILLSAYQKGELNALVQKLLDVSESENQLKFNASPVENNLPLLSFLKTTQHFLLEEYATTLYRFAAIISKADNIVSEREENLLKNIYNITHPPVQKAIIANNEREKNSLQEVSEKQNSLTGLSKNVITIDELKNDSLEEILNELNSLIGLSSVKSEINSLVNFVNIQKAREKSGLKSSSISYHMVFTGNPGTGKTTVARLVAKIYKHLGILSGGQLIETDRSGLIAEYAGQTAIKTNKTVDSAINGVLFIDEAYSLIGENKDDFGRESVATLIKRMEDDRDKLVLILAGYTDEMSHFIDTNPGFKSRFNRYIHFPDYTTEELLAIFESNCQKLDFILTEDARERLISLFENAYLKKNKSFGNGRFARNIFEKTMELQANRIAKEAFLTKEILTTITAEDIVE